MLKKVSLLMKVSPIKKFNKMMILIPNRNEWNQVNLSLIVVSMYTDGSKMKKGLRVFQAVFCAGVLVMLSKNHLNEGKSVYAMFSIPCVNVSQQLVLRAG